MANPQLRVALAGCVKSALGNSRKSPVNVAAMLILSDANRESNNVAADTLGLGAVVILVALARQSVTCSV